MPGSSTVTSTASSVSNIFASGRNLSLCPGVPASGPKNSEIHFGKSVSKSLNCENRGPHGVNVRSMIVLLLLAFCPFRCHARKSPRVAVNDPPPDKACESSANLSVTPQSGECFSTAHKLKKCVWRGFHWLGTLRRSAEPSAHRGVLNVARQRPWLIQSQRRRIALRRGASSAKICG